jgi:hypothetical protein
MFNVAFFNDLPLPPSHCEEWPGIRTGNFDSRSFWQVRSFRSVNRDGAGTVDQD